LKTGASDSDKTQLIETVRHEQDVFKERYERLAFPGSEETK
jgi:hypothetical protein